MGHFKAKCYNFMAMMNNKNKLEGKPLVIVTFESHLVYVMLNCWLNDSGTFTHVINFLRVSKESGYQARMRLI